MIVQADHGLGEYLELSYNYLVTRIRDDDPDRAVVRQGHGFSLGATVGRWTPFVGLAWRPEHVDGRVPCLAQVGTGVRVARDVQVDVSVGPRPEHRGGVLGHLGGAVVASPAPLTDGGRRSTLSVRRGRFRSRRAVRARSPELGATHPSSSVAQWQSIRLLTGGL